MENINITADEIKKMADIYSQIRSQLSSYMTEREFPMSNSQIFTFLMYAPLALAIASDRVIDEQELKILEKITKNIDVKQIVSLDLQEILTLIPEPQQVMFNEEFNMRIDAELLYLARNIDKYEHNIIQAARLFLSISNDPTAANSLTNIYSKWFDFISTNSVSKQKAVEAAKIKEYKQRLGI